MAKKCHCGMETRKPDELYCQKHAEQKLQSLLDSGYLESLSYRTASGMQVASSQKFLTIEEEREDETVLYGTTSSA